MATRERLEAQIFEAPDDVAAYLVYGDWLQSIGDPRGRLIAAQLARVGAPPGELSEAETTLIAALGDPVVDIEPAPRVEWFAGFWRVLYAGSFGWSPKAATDAHIATLLGSSSARFVREIRIDGAVTPSVLESVAMAHRTLERLDVSLRGAKLDDRALANLRTCTRLEHLHLFSCESITSRGLVALRELKALESIDLRNHPLDDKGVDSLVGLPRLSRVFFNAVSRDLTHHGMTGLAFLPLISLELDGDTLDDERIVPLANHGSLANLEIGGAPITERGAAAIATLPLRRLYLPSSTIGDAGVALLGGLAKTLRSLHLGHSATVSDRACEAIGRLTRLAFLDLSSTQVTGAGLRHIAALRDLERLDLAFLKLADRDITALLGLSRLTELNLAYSQVTDAAIDLLVDALPELERIDLTASAITRHSIERLAELPKLYSLGLEDCAPEAIELAREHSRWSVNTRDLLELSDSLEHYE
jgi:uncharacterized protein (TIGR02996 family)